MDAAGYFEEPVTEDQAPGYGKVIKHPMCFQVGNKERYIAQVDITDI